MNNCGKDRIFIIASSNRPDLIDLQYSEKGVLIELFLFQFLTKKLDKDYLRFI